MADKAPEVGSAQFNFVKDVAKTVLKARRMLSYTYVYRFLLRGKLKKRFCDFEIKELESSIEKLDMLNEQKEPLSSFLEENELLVGHIMLGKKFSDHKS